MAEKRKISEEEVFPDNEPIAKMSMVSQRNLNLATLNKHRFPCGTFGFSLDLTSDYIMYEFTDLIARYKHLELYCFAEDASTHLYNPPTSEVDLFQAFFAPRCIAPRTSMIIGSRTLMTEHTLQSMWLRLVAHYFEWLAGVTELQYFCERDKVRLAVSQLCKVVCYSVCYNNYAHSLSAEHSDVFFFGGGFYFDPARSNDPKMIKYCNVLANIICRNVIPQARRIELTLEEFVITKLIILFDCTNLSGLSSSGVEFARSVCNKYRSVLSQHVRHQLRTNPDTSHLDADALNKISIQRIRALLNIINGIEPVAQYDDQSLAEMVETNYGGMAGQLQRQVHTESRRCCQESNAI